MTVEIQIKVETGYLGDIEVTRETFTVMSDPRGSISELLREAVAQVERAYELTTILTT